MFIELEKAFQHHLSQETCWAIGTHLYLQTVVAINALRQIEQPNDAQKAILFYSTLERACTHTPYSEPEIQQLLSLKQFLSIHPEFTEESKRSILNDLYCLNSCMQ